MSWVSVDMAVGLMQYAMRNGCPCPNWYHLSALDKDGGDLLDMEITSDIEISEEQRALLRQAYGMVVSCPNCGWTTPMAVRMTP